MSFDPTQVKVGDVIESAPLMGRLTPEKVVFTCTRSDETRADFEGTYFGVPIARVSYMAGGKGWVWLD